MRETSTRRYPWIQALNLTPLPPRVTLATGTRPRPGAFSEDDKLPHCLPSRNWYVPAFIRCSTAKSETRILLRVKDHDASLSDRLQALALASVTITAAIDASGHLRPVVMDIERRFLRRWHLIANAIIQVTGDTAEGESYGLAAAVAEREGRMVTDVFGGRYLDRFVRRAGQWQITKRVYVLDWQRSFETDSAAEAMPGLVWSNGFTPAHPLYRKL